MGKTWAYFMCEEAIWVKYKLADRGDHIFVLVNRNESKVIQQRKEKRLDYSWLGNGKGKRPIIDSGAALKAQLRSDSVNLN